jgi:hypothetical protein
MILERKKIYPHTVFFFLKTVGYGSTLELTSCNEGENEDGQEGEHKVPDEGSDDERAAAAGRMLTMTGATTARRRRRTRCRRRHRRRAAPRVSNSDDDDARPVGFPSSSSSRRWT